MSDDIEDKDYFVEFSTRAQLDDPDPEGSSVRHYIGKIMCCDSDADEESFKVGEISAYIVDLNSPSNAFMDADAESEELGEAISCLVDKSGSDLRDSLINKNVVGMMGGILFLDRILIDPEHRGSFVGLKALWHTIHVLGNSCGTAICKPYPMRPEEIDPLVNISKKETDKGIKKLAAYWSRLGFKKLAKTPFMVINLEYRRPSLRAALTGTADMPPNYSLSSLEL